MIDLAKLRAPFAPDKISWRLGSTSADKTKGMALAYIDARDVMGRLDEVAGHAWQCEYVPMPNGTCCCRIGLKLDDEWVWRSNGSMNFSDSDKADAKEMAEKGSYSDAFKRAAVLWGIGQYLYDLDSPWVEIEPAGRSFKIKADQYTKLRTILGKSAPATIHAKPEPAKTIASDINEATIKARKWADDAIIAIKKMDAKVLAAWETHNAKVIVRLRDIDPDKHRQLLAAMQECDGLAPA